MAVARLQRARRSWALLAVFGAFSILAIQAPSAGALVVFDRALHREFSIVPSIGQTAGMASSRAAGAVGSARFACTTDCTQLQYHNGPVQHGETLYLLFWAPSTYSPAFPASYVTGMGTWVNDLAAANGTLGNPVSVNTQYYDLSGPGGSKSYVPYSVTNAGTLTDTNAFPSSGGCTPTPCLTDAQIRTELSAYIQAHSLPTGLNVQYYVMLPQGVKSCFDSAGNSCSYTNFCGYHSSMTVSGTQVTYADMPWLYGTSGCDVNSAFHTGYPNSNFVDPVVGVFSHELSETMTDPVVGSGWTDGIGNEIGDKCAYMYGSGGKGSMSGMNSSNGPNYWNVKLGSDVYLLQQEFDNQAANCVSRMTETWSGTTPTGAGAAHWSNAGNWGASIAPGAGSSSNDVVHTLSFPALAGCSAQPAAATCYTSSNDLTNLTASGLSVDSGSGYAIGGNAMTLGGGGISSTTFASSSNPSSFSPPMTLGANQTWSIDGGTHGVGKLTLGGTVTGSSRTVNINLSNSGALVLGGDTEVGNVAIAGASSANTGANAPLNGSVTVNAGLNSTDGNSVSLTDAALLTPGTPTVGGLTSVGGDVEVGQGTVPAGAMNVQSGVSLDAASRLELFIDHWGTIAGTDYSKVLARGNVTLGGSLVLGSSPTCPSLTLGDQITLITTTGSLSGTFFGVPNGQDVQLSCSGTQPKIQINYSPNSVTGTVVSLSPPSNASLPTVSGTARQEQTLTMTQGQWTNSPTSTGDQWQSCDSSGANCSTIPGAISGTYDLTAADVGHTLRVQESATNSAGTGSAVASAPTAVVVAPGGGSGGGTAGGSGGGSGSGGSSGGGSGTLISGAPSVSGSVVDVPLSCTGRAGTKCSVALTLTVTETTRGGKVVAVTAAAHRRHKRSTRVLVVGSGTVTLTAGQSQLVQLVLNAAGQHLLALRHLLSANLVVGQAGQTVSHSTVTFRSGRTRKHRHRR